MAMFNDRTDAGRQLAEAMAGRVTDPAIVLALPRGGVPVAAEVAAVLDTPLDVLGVRKIGAPGRPEFGIGAVAEGGGLVLDERSLDQLGLAEQDLDSTIAAERREVDRRVERYRRGRPLPDLEDKTVVVYAFVSFDRTAALRPLGPEAPAAADEEIQTFPFAV